MLRIIMILALSIITGCASKDNDMSPELKKAKLYYNQGTQDLVNRDYTKALKNLLMASELNPTDTKVHNNLGMAYYFKKHQELALKHIKKALELDPKNTEARMNMATIYLNNNDYDRAMPIYQEILKDLVYESQFKTHFNIALIYLRQNNITMAETHFKKSIEVFESYCPSHYQLGQIYYNKGDYEKAYRSYYNSGLGQCYNSPEPHYMQGLALIQMERYADAKEKFETVLGRFDSSKFAPLARRKLLSIMHLIEHDTKSEFSLKSKLKKKLMNRDF